MMIGPTYFPKILVTSNLWNIYILFCSQDKMGEEGGVYQLCSSADEREKYSAMLSEASDWQYEQPDDAKKYVRIY